VGLRERKKARTRAAIQDAALRLYLEHGYEATTVEQIAAAAEVSPSTFFRYFPTKADTVLYDRLDPVLMESFLRQPAELSPIAAIRASIKAVYSRLGAEAIQLEQTRGLLVAREPELRAFYAMKMEEGARMLAEVVAARTGRQPADFAIVTFTGAVVGALIGAFLMSVNDPEPDVIAYVDAALAHLEAGLPL
jgi:AcrR family transcriptional regulator